MNNYKLLLEASLFEFDWGQDKALNTVDDPEQFQMTPENINAGTLADFESCIAKYHNWVFAIRHKEADTKTELLTKPEVLTFRAKILTAIEKLIASLAQLEIDKKIATMLGVPYDGTEEANDEILRAVLLEHVRQRPEE